MFWLSSLTNESVFLQHKYDNMYGIDIFDNIKLTLDWYIIYYGIKNNLLCTESAQEYVFRKLERDETISEEELELAWKINDPLEVLEKIEKFPDIQLDSTKQRTNAKNKIRIAIIANLRKRETNISKLFEEINLIYEIFDYPADMECFVSYMPPDDGYIPNEHTKEENESRLLRKLDCFISDQLSQY